MLAASLPDLDGFGFFISDNLYWDYHHKLGHSLVAGLVLAAALTLVSSHRLKAAVAYLGLFHLHLLADYFGSGPEWHIFYFWPFSQQRFLSEHVWELYSWQNLSAAGALLAWTIAIAIWQGRTPLEWMMPSLDRQLVRWLRQWVVREGEPQSTGPSRL